MSWPVVGRRGPGPLLFSGSAGSKSFGGQGVRVGADDQESPPSVDEILAAKHLWYHTMDLAPGVTTPGWIDLRDVVNAPAIPRDLAGKRALDLGMFDGFWAFEMERRGARVIGVDIDEIPPPDTPRIHRARMVVEADGAEPGTGFRLLKRYFGSSVERRSLNVYDLSPDRVGGPADLIFLGALLPHLRDPVRALERVHDTLAADGLLICFEPVDPDPPRSFGVRLWGSLKRRAGRSHQNLSSEPTARYLALVTPWTWWYPNRACLEQWIRTAGFTRVEPRSTTWVTDRDGIRQQLATVHARP